MQTELDQSRLSRQVITAELKGRFRNERQQALREHGFGGWLKTIEEEVLLGIPPEISSEEGFVIAERFSESGVDLVNFERTQFGKTTETPTMKATMKDLERLFGEGAEDKVDEFIINILGPLRYGEENEERQAGGPSKFLKYGVSQIITGVLSAARFHQMDTDECREIYPDIPITHFRQAALEDLSAQLHTKIDKGDKREKGFMKSEIIREQIHNLGGSVRDIPPGGAESIGEFLDGLLEQSSE